MSNEQIMGLVILILGVVMVVGGLIAGLIKYRKHQKETMSGAFYNRNIPMNKKFK